MTEQYPKTNSNEISLDLLPLHFSEGLLDELKRDFSFLKKDPQKVDKSIKCFYFDIIRSICEHFQQYEISRSTSSDKSTFPEYLDTFREHLDIFLKHNYKEEERIFQTKYFKKISEIN